MKKESRNLKSITEKKSNIGILYGYREHRGSLQESLKTKNYICENEFRKLLKEYYHYYGYDERCNQLLFILNDLIIPQGKPTWMFIEIKDLKENENIKN